MSQKISSLETEIGEIENVFMLLADYTKNIMLGDNVFSEISCNQYLALLFLNDKAKVTVNDIVKSQNLTYPGTTLLLDELSKQELIERKRSDEDRRLVFVSITAKGREMINKIHKRRQGVLKQIFEDFEPVEMRLIMDSFSILKNKLNALKDNK